MCQYIHLLLSVSFLWSQITLSGAHCSNLCCTSLDFEFYRSVFEPDITVPADQLFSMLLREECERWKRCWLFWHFSTDVILKDVVCRLCRTAGERLLASKAWKIQMIKIKYNFFLFLFYWSFFTGDKNHKIQDLHIDLKKNFKMIYNKT